MSNNYLLGEIMKKLLGLLFAIFGLFLVLQSPTDVQAAKFKVQNYNVVADVQKNGDVDLTQKITYSFDGGYHGVYYNQDLRGTSGASDPEVSVSGGENSGKITQSDSGKDNTFKLTKTNNSMNMKVYHMGFSDGATFTYKYKIYGVITNYLDTAELNWKIIGSGWDNELNNVKLTVNLPQNNISQLQAWTHGPLSGHTEVSKKNGQVVMTVDHNPVNQFVESHIIFPVSVTPNNSKKVNKNAKARIQDHEKNLAIEANNTRRRKSGIYLGLMILGIVVIAALYIYQFIKLRKNPGQRHIIPTPLYHIFDEPEFSPSMTKVILDRKDKADSLSLTADLLDEVGKRRMKIDKIGKDYEITALVPPINTFFKYLIEDIGDGKTVGVKQIRKFARGSDRNNKKMVGKFDDWAKAAATGREKYLDMGNLDLVDSFKVTTVATDIILLIMFAISMLLSSHLLTIGIILAVVAVGVWGIYWLVKKRITPYTDLGEQEVNKIRAFKRMLEDIDDIKMAEVGDLILWEQFLPYAVVFGVSDKVIKALKINFGTDTINQSAIAYYYIGANSFIASNTGFQSAFLGAISAGGSSSISGGSGGFSGGSSGGFGGGSGGGAF